MASSFELLTKEGLVLTNRPAYQAPHFLFIVTFFWCLLALFIALGSQYFGGLAPCVLCHYQRYPYAVGMVVSLIGVLFWPTRLMVILGIVCIAASGAVAFFHVGVEQAWWAGTNACAGNALNPNQDPSRFIDLLRQKSMVRCDTPAWSWAGISMAGYNLLYAVSGMILLGGSLWRFGRRKNNET